MRADAPPACPTPRFWRSLVLKRADILAGEGASPATELLPFMLAGGAAAPLVDRLAAEGQFGLAAAVAAVEATG